MTGDDTGTDPGRSVLADPSRLRALERLGLTTEGDARMDDFASWVRQAVDVPVALVSLVAADVQVFPGMAGLPEPWASARSTPLSHSFCRHVVLTAEPLLVTDAREHPLLRDNLAVPDIGVVAYAGMPLTDDTGRVLGSLCAVDTVPRRWTDAEVDTLRRIARACSTDLRLRLARHDAGQEEIRRDEFEAAQRRSFDRSQTLLGASQAFSATTTAEDVYARIRDLVRSDLHPDVVGIVVVGEDGHLHVHDPTDPALPSTYDIDASAPSARAVRENRLVHYPNRRAFDAAHPATTRDALRLVGVHELVAVPLPGTDGPVGALVLGWATPDGIEPADLLTIASIAGYAGQAFTRADTLRYRIAVAQEMQNAMLTTLPTIEGLEMAARYEPADSRENVGGDWYDVGCVVDPASPDECVVAVSVGDVMGHALGAATIMGQIRSMLRQSAWDHPGGPPSTILRAFETANLGLGLAAGGTAVVAQLRPAGAGRWALTWTNAGHPPPVLLHPDGRVEILHAHDALFGFPFSLAAPRHDHRCTVEPGSILFLYTDGLVERRNRDIDAGTDVLVGMLWRYRDRGVQELVDAAVDMLTPDAPDDVVAFAVRFPFPDASRHEEER